MNAVKIFRVFAWSAVAIAGGVLIGFSGILPGAPQLPRSGTVSSSGVAAVGGSFELTTHKGQRFTDADVAGKPYLVFFGFTFCPDICPTTLSELTIMMSELGADADRFTPLLITVDPERDNQEMLAEYMSAFDSRIVGLRGTPEQTAAAARTFKAYYKKVPLDGGDYTMDHTAGVLLMGANGRYIGMMDMDEARETRIAKLRRLIEKNDPRYPREHPKMDPDGLPLPDTEVSR
ncbi:SCO family protein [Aminobacter anthyllidis]|uniref:SCO family protein n=1 Tax=Aminobacter anthyllidis TaxID=1035067 RepID=A0A9X1A9U1_9HYPH|nr:SCO family protein [Aminobacter anthyllidis]MBT1155862.1 SCO family protein [Aminobacter anthyllidis]